MAFHVHGKPTQHTTEQSSKPTQVSGLLTSAKKCDSLANNIFIPIGLGLGVGGVIAGIAAAAGALEVASAPLIAGCIIGGSIALLIILLGAAKITLDLSEKHKKDAERLQSQIIREATVS